jgi:thiol-disulfide isomerase/thioredoxin
MKRSAQKVIFLFFFLSTVLSVTGKEVVITGRLLPISEENNITWYAPFYGKYYNNGEIRNEANRQQTAKDGSFICRIDIENPVFIKLMINKTFPLYCFAEPGDTLQVTIDVSKLDGKTLQPGWLSFTGKNAAGQQLYNQFFSLPYPISKFLPIHDIYSASQLSADRLIDSIKHTITRSLKFLDSLQERKAITASFHAIAGKTLKASLLREALKPFIRNSKMKERYTAADIEKIRQAFFREQSPLDPHLTLGVLSINYVNDHCEYLDIRKRGYKSNADIQDTVIHSEKTGPLTIGKTYAAQLYAADKKIQELLWGTMLLNVLQVFPDEVKPDDIKAFSLYHPGSIFEEGINELEGRITAARAANTANAKPGEYYFLDTLQQLQSFQDLLSGPLSNKWLYVDLWASWCLPCRMEFQENDSELDSTLKAHRIERLYISIDNKAQQKTWLNLIRFYRLEGFHLLASEAMVEDIRKTIYGKEEKFSIPRYILINKNGKILNADAPRPSSPHLIQLLQKTPVAAN